MANPDLTRKDGWEEILAAEIEAARGRPFSWADHNCGRWACDVLQAMTGHDLFAPFRRARTKRALYAAFRRVAGGGVEAAALRQFGAPLPTPLLARRGDPVLVDTDEGPAVGLCAGASCVFVSERGLVTLPLSAARLAWRIG